MPQTLLLHFNQPEHLSLMIPRALVCMSAHASRAHALTGLAAGTFNSGMPFMVDTLRHVLYGKHRSSMADASARADPQPRPRRTEPLHVLP